MLTPNINLSSLVSFPWHNSVPAPDDTTSKVYSVKNNEENLQKIMTIVKEEFDQLKPEETTKKEQLQEIVKRCKVYTAYLSIASLNSTTAKVANVAENFQVPFAKDPIAAKALRILSANLPASDSSDLISSFEITFNAHGDDGAKTEVLSLPKFYKEFLAEKSTYWKDLSRFGETEQNENQVDLGDHITKENFSTLLKIVSESPETFPLDKLGVNGLLDFIEQIDFFDIPACKTMADKAVVEVIKSIDSGDPVNALNLHGHLQATSFFKAAKRPLDNYFIRYLIQNPQNANQIPKEIKESIQTADLREFRALNDKQLEELIRSCPHLNHLFINSSIISDSGIETVHFFV